MQPGFGKHKRMEWEKSVWMKVEIRDPKLNVTLAVQYFSIKARVISGWITLLGVIGTP